MDPDAWANRLASVLTASRTDRAALARSLADITGTETVFDDEADVPPSADRIPWTRVRHALRTELEALAADPNAAAGNQARIADAAFALRFVLTPGEFADEIQTLGDLGRDTAVRRSAGTVAWVNTPEEAARFIRSLNASNNTGDNAAGRAVLAVNPAAKDLINALRSDPSLHVDELRRQGRLAFLRGSRDWSALDLLERARQSPVIAAHSGQMDLAVLQGETLPPNFFALTSAQLAALKRAATVLLIDQASRAVPIDGDLLPTWGKARAASTSA